MTVKELIEILNGMREDAECYFYKDSDRRMIDVDDIDTSIWGTVEFNVPSDLG